VIGSRLTIFSCPCWSSLGFVGCQVLVGPVWMCLGILLGHLQVVALVQFGCGWVLFGNVQILITMPNLASPLVHHALCRALTPTTMSQPYYCSNHAPTSQIWKDRFSNAPGPTHPCIVPHRYGTKDPAMRHPPPLPFASFL